MAGGGAALPLLRCRFWSNLGVLLRLCLCRLPPHVVLLHFRTPWHHSTRVCLSRLSSAPAGSTKFSKHRKHPAENILIKQTPHKILFWGGKKPSPPICQHCVGRHEKTSWQAGARSSWASAAGGSVWAHGRHLALRSGLASLNHRWSSPLGISKCIRNTEHLGDRKRCRIFEAEEGTRSS